MTAAAASGQVRGLLLAAGGGRRMGGPKALVVGPDGVPWVVRAVRALLEGGCAGVDVVVGAQATAVAALVGGLPVTVVEATDWAQGMGASLRAGLARRLADPASEAAAVLVALVDTPGMTAAVVDRVRRSATPDGDTVLARAAFAGVPAHPVLIGRAHWAGVAAAAQGDAGAREYLARHAVRLVDCTGLGDGTDLDTPEQARAYAGAVTTGEHPSLAPEHAHAPRTRDSSRIAPPQRRVVTAVVSADPLDVRAHEVAVADAAAGAVVSFAGVVRDHDGGRRVSGIEYVAHPSAGAVLTDVVADLAARSDCEAIAVSHRIGALAVGEAAFVVAVSGAHRQEAFAACALIVDEVKHRLPVWKRQVFDDGTDEWVACP